MPPAAFPGDLTEVIGAWQSLPDSLRHAVLTIVRSCAASVPQSIVPHAASPAPTTQGSVDRG